MSVSMVRAEVQADKVADVITGAQKMFSAIEEAQPEGVRYASCLLPDGVTFLALLEVEEGIENPLPALPAFREFQENLRGWLAGPPSPEPMRVIGSYRLFGQ
ncbi:hypothetical protein FNH05_07455 [Amycolatopsis rhizosphaerae]|uniref:Uncharacterized protein n=1 Tax=Amycolatopsis rhizosphaerae TaxID=2053003 RepID=A0A558D8S1_9PSEU|nr:hypothetical protein [Amycolatopsis rhizosphaerae]TVT57405.1 hypothetical protein FNH05_07455 [Amycolatopsis rhizosphaerae]